MSLSQVAPPLKGGVHFPLFLLTLQAMQKELSDGQSEAGAKEKLAGLVNESGIRLQDMVPQVQAPGNQNHGTLTKFR
jgi:hypothetical protein